MLFEARSIVGGYRAIRIVNDVSLGLDSGETLAVLGRNGVGKTTLLRTLMGLADRFGGEIRVTGQPIAPRDPRALASLSFPTIAACFPGLPSARTSGSHGTRPTPGPSSTSSPCFRT